MTGATINLGHYLSNRTPARLRVTDLSTHMLVCGATGSGKSKLLEQMARQIIIDRVCGGPDNGGLALIDPKGAFGHALVAWMAENNIDLPLVVFDPLLDDPVVAISPLRPRPGEPSTAAAARFVSTLAAEWGEMDMNNAPMLEHYATLIARTLVESSLTLAEAPFLLDTSDNDVRSVIIDMLEDDSLKSDWKSLLKMTPAARAMQLGSTRRRFRRLVEPDSLRLSLGQNASFNAVDAIRGGWIVIVTSGASLAGNAEATTLAALVMSELLSVAFDRSTGGRPFTVVVDELHACVTPKLGPALAMSRSSGLRLVLATQSPEQLRRSGPAGRRLFDEMLMNCRSKLIFALDPINARAVAASIGVRADPMVRQPNRHGLLSTVSDPEPRPVRTADVMPATMTHETASRYLVDRLSQLWMPFIVSRNDAIRQLSDRARHLRHGHDVSGKPVNSPTPEYDEPDVFARRLQQTKGGVR